ncbi:MAG: hypothetical protein CMI53_03170 [Parcubacteria group bacterium]|jgi:hypothetical protein|nr:hypothetical protein [Parcubacteria group bacterium]|tara:strand:+ start:5483 stop:5761 length:279 start_codon:yes stop_codon:yes gene_type:complete
MSREVVSGPQFAMAFGVDHHPAVGAFVQVWDLTKGDPEEPCFDPEQDEFFNGVEEHNRTTTGGRNLTEEFVLLIARRHGILLEAKKVYEVFD